MAWLRHAPRHIQGTVIRYMTDQLVDLGWMNDPPADVSTANLPFGPDLATLVTIRDHPAITDDGLRQDVKAGTLAITMGDEPMPDLEELGGPLSTQEYPIFFDCFQDQEATTIALASDVRDILLGRLPGSSRHLDVKNMATGKVWAGWKLEFDDVIRQAPEHRFALPWHVVKATAVLTFPEVMY